MDLIISLYHESDGLESIEKDEKVILAKDISTYIVKYLKKLFRNYVKHVKIKKKNNKYKLQLILLEQQLQQISTNLNSIEQGNEEEYDDEKCVNHLLYHP